MTRLRLNNGFTLIEAMIAVAVLIVGVLILEKNFVASIIGNNSAKLTTASVADASGLLEELQALDFNFICDGSDANHNLALGCVDLQDRNGVGNMAATVDGAGNVAADLAVTWNADGQRVTTTYGNLLPANCNDNNITVFINSCENCPFAAGGNFIANTKLIRVISRYRDPGRLGNVAGDINNDPLFQRTRQNQTTMVEYVRARVR